MIFFFVILACQEKIQDSAEITDSAEPTSEIQPEDVVEEAQATLLEEGNWAYSNITISENTCGFALEQQYYLQQALMSVSYDLNYVADNNYILSFPITEEEQASTTCVNDMEQFICDDLVFPIPTHDSIVTEVYASVGMISSPTRIEGTVTKSHSCEGPDCDRIAQDNNMVFPCDVVMEYTFNFFD